MTVDELTMEFIHEVRERLDKEEIEYITEMDSNPQTVVFAVSLSRQRFLTINPTHWWRTPNVKEEEWFLVEDFKGYEDRIPHAAYMTLDEFVALCKSEDLYIEKEEKN